MSAKRRPRNGKPVSTPAEPGSKHSKTKHLFPPPQLERLLAAAYDQYHKLEDPALEAKFREYFVFHMTDWMEDLERLATLYKDPSPFDRETAGDVVFGFLVHALPHLLAAGRLLLDEVCDPFVELEKKA